MASWQLVFTTPEYLAPTFQRQRHGARQIYCRHDGADRNELVSQSRFHFQKSAFEFRDRYTEVDDYFSGSGQAYPGRIWDTNFVEDVRSIALYEWKERGAGARTVLIELCENILAALVSEFPVGTYKKAHRHGPGNHVIVSRRHRLLI